MAWACRHAAFATLVAFAALCETCDINDLGCYSLLQKSAQPSQLPADPQDVLTDNSSASDLSEELRSQSDTKNQELEGHLHKLEKELSVIAAEEEMEGLLPGNLRRGSWATKPRPQQAPKAEVWTAGRDLAATDPRRVAAPHSRTPLAPDEVDSGSTTKAAAGNEVLMQLGANLRRRLSRRQIVALQGDGAEQLEDYKDNHMALESALSQDRISSIVGSITKQAFGKEITDFVTAQKSRYVKTEGNAHAGEYLKQQFEDLGYETMVEDMEAAGKIGNVIAFKKGKGDPAEFVVAGAHFDSVNWEDTEADAPGAEDNGSGTAALLQIARSLKDVDTDRSVAFVAFNGEEEGTLGSMRFVEELQKKGGKFAKFGSPRAALIMDEVAYPSPTAGHERKAILETKGVLSELPTFAALMDTTHRSYEKEMSIIKGVSQNTHGFGSDHITFCDAGIPALLLIERDNMAYADMYGHSARDTLDHVDNEFGAAMSRVAARTVLALATEKKDK